MGAEIDAKAGARIDRFRPSVEFVTLTGDANGAVRPTPQIAGRVITRWLVDAALCALIVAAFYGGMRPDPTTFDRD
jgi:hypothetical protein